MGYEVLEFPLHKNVTVDHGLALDEIGSTNHCWLGLSEIGEAACDYPLVFLKAQETGKFRLVALMGFQPDTNLFVLNDQYVGTYLPKQFARAPFALTRTDGGDLVAAIDLDHPRARDHSGTALFDDAGNETEFTTKTRATLTASVQDQGDASAFVDVLLEHDLLAPMPIDLDPAGDAKPVRLDGLYTIHRGKLADLSDQAIIDLHKLGYLGAANVVASSLAQIVRLQQLHNAQAQGNTRVTALANVSVGLPY